jgi:hypothetical protein
MLRDSQCGAPLQPLLRFHNQAFSFRIVQWKLAALRHNFPWQKTHSHIMKKSCKLLLPLAFWNRPFLRWSQAEARHRTTLWTDKSFDSTHFI